MSLPAGQPTTEDIRRKLEGRLEVVERAREHYLALASRLRAEEGEGGPEDVRWLRRLREEEPALDEALETLERRARVEDWSPRLPALMLAREVRELRPLLAKLVRERSGVPIPTFFGMPVLQELRLADELERLMNHLGPARTPPPQTPAREAVLQGGYVTGIQPLKPLLLMTVVFCLGARPLRHLFFAEPRAQPAAVALVGLYALFKGTRLWRQYLRSGRYQLTREALLWWPSRGPSVYLPLNAISHAVYTGPASEGVWVVEKRGAILRLEHVAEAQRLAQLLNEAAAASRSR